MKIAVAQINVTVGDIGGNLERIRAGAKQDADLVVFPELTLCGYPPEDLILRSSFVDACMQALESLAKETAHGPALAVGCPWRQDGKIYNAALLLAEGRVAHIQPKRCLPNYGIFDEKRIFTPGEVSSCVEFKGKRLALMVCEDVWHEKMPQEIAAQKPDHVIVINASPYEAGKQAVRLSLVAGAARLIHAPLHYVNLVGGQDDIVFDGGSFSMDANGNVTSQWPQFSEANGTSANASLPTGNEEIWQALCLALRDYVGKNGFPNVLLGLSGGIDSALVAAIAADALGAGHVHGVLLPSPFTSQESIDDALESAKLLGIQTSTVSIAAARNAVHDALAATIPAEKRNTLLVDGNIQARLRGVQLMALSNATGAMLLNTGNKSEIAVGYTTLYGDACGGYAVLKDVYKTQVWELARWRNGQSRLIPERSITKAPTAELAPGQKDEDQLPPYAVLDKILQRFIEQGESVADIALEFPRATVENVANMIRTAEYKRRQLPPGAKISPMLFGRDWRYPLTHRFKG